MGDLNNQFCCKLSSSNSQLHIVQSFDGKFTDCMIRVITNELDTHARTCTDTHAHVHTHIHTHALYWGFTQAHNKQVHVYIMISSGRVSKGLRGL